MKRAPIHVVTYRKDLDILNRRRHLPPPCRTHQKKKGKGSYNRTTLKNECRKGGNSPLSSLQKSA